MVSRSRSKFDEWLLKINKSLQSHRKSSLSKLASDFKYFKYWAEKLKSEAPKDFVAIEKEYMRTAGRTGNALHLANSNYLKNADKHGKGTKVRIAELLKFAYHYGNYTHDCFIEAGQERDAKKNLKLFWDAYGQELIDYVTLLDGFQIDSVLRLARQSQTVGLRISKEWLLTLESLIRSPDKLLIDQINNQLETAEKNLGDEETITAINTADQALELFLRDLCSRFGCDESTTNKRGTQFRKWGFNDYVTYLSAKGEINDFERGNFLRFHDWRNSAQHIGMEPSVRSVRIVVDEIKRFVEEHSY
jgi:hypothetical protein